MARIKEFKGLRPRKDFAALVAELPYDVATRAEARAIAGKNRYNFYHITRPEVDLLPEIDIYNPAVYNKGRENLLRFIDEGTLVYDGEENLYLYTLIMQGRSQTGLVACVHIDDYINNIVKKHELVFDLKVEDRQKHINILNANTGLVFLFYKEDGSKRILFEKAMNIQPDYDFTSNDGVRHIFRSIPDKEMIMGFKDVFRNEIFYIADGHHRALSAYRVGLERRKNNPNHNGDERYNWFLAVIFPHNELEIMPYNRVISDLNGLSIDAFFYKIKSKYIIERGNAAIEKHTFRMYLDAWYKLVPKFQIPDDAIEGLDVQILQNTILDPILNIREPKNDKRIEFIGGIRGQKELERLVLSGEYRVAFSLYPVSIDDLIRVSEEYKLMWNNKMGCTVWDTETRNFNF